MNEKLAVYYSFARSGGTLLNRCLGCINGNLVLSEVNPHGAVVPIDVQASDWMKLIDEPHLKTFKQLSYGEKIKRLNDIAHTKGSHLVVRDWDTINFLDGVDGFHSRASGVLEQRLYLSHVGFQCREIVFVRKAASVYESLARTIPQCKTMPVKEFGERYLQYACAVAQLPVFHFEDFCLQPVVLMHQICDVLQVNYSPRFINEFVEFQNCTGDNLMGPHSSSNRFKAIAPIPDRVQSSAYQAALKDPGCRKANELLGYA
jgi:hypothetical protein